LVRERTASLLPSTLKLSRKTSASFDLLNIIIYYYHYNSLFLRIV
jgi:hypothetical protein